MIVERMALIWCVILQIDSHLTESREIVLEVLCKLLRMIFTTAIGSVHNKYWVIHDH